MAFATSTESHGSVESVKYGRDAGRGQPLIAEGKFRPAKERTSGDDYVHTGTAKADLPASAEYPAHLIGDIHHTVPDELWQ